MISAEQLEHALGFQFFKVTSNKSHLVIRFNPQHQLDKIAKEHLLQQCHKLDIAIIYIPHSHQITIDLDKPGLEAKLAKMTSLPGVLQALEKRTAASAFFQHQFGGPTLIRHMTHHSIARHKSPPPQIEHEKAYSTHLFTALEAMGFSLQHTTTAQGLASIKESAALLPTRRQTNVSEGQTANAVSHLTLREGDFFVFFYLVPTVFATRPVADYQTGALKPTILHTEADQVFAQNSRAVIRCYCNSFLLNSSLAPAVRIGQLTLQVKYEHYVNPLDSSITYRLCNAQGDTVWQHTEQVTQTQFSVEQFRQHLFLRLQRILDAATDHDPTLETSLIEKLQTAEVSDFVAQLIADIIGPIEVLVPGAVPFNERINVLSCSVADYNAYKRTAQAMIAAMKSNDTAQYRIQLKRLKELLLKNPQLLHSTITNPGEVTAYDIVAVLVSGTHRQFNDKNCLGALTFLLKYPEIQRAFQVNRVFEVLSQENMAQDIRDPQVASDKIMAACQTMHNNRLTTNYLLLALQTDKAGCAGFLLQQYNANIYPHCIPQYTRTGRIGVSAHSVAAHHYPKLVSDAPKMPHTAITAASMLCNHSQTLAQINLLAKLLSERGMRVSFDGQTITFYCKISQTSQQQGCVNSSLTFIIPRTLGADIPFFDTRKVVADAFGLGCYQVKLNTKTEHALPCAQHALFTSLEEIRDRLLTCYLIRLLTTAQNAFYQATHGKPHPNTGKGGGSAKILLHPNPLAGFTITAKSSAEGILIHITESDTAEAHRELVFRYLQFMLPGYTSQITQSKEGIHVKDISLSNLLDEQLQRQINYYGIIHEAPDGTIAMAMSVRKDTMMTVLGPRLRVCEKGYATAGGYNLEPGHPDIRQQAVKDSMTEFGVPLPPEYLVCIHNDAGHALLLAQMSEKPRLKPEEAEFDPSSGQFFSIAQLVKDQLHLRDLPTLDHYLSKHRAPAIQAHLQRTLKFITSCHVSFNLEHTINLGSGQRLLGERYGTLTIELVFDEKNAKKVFPAAKKYLARQLDSIDGIIFDQKNNRIILPAKWADQLWLIVKTEQPPASLEDAAKNEDPAPEAQATEDPEMQQILGDDQPPAAEKENQHTAAVLLPPELITKALLLDYLASLFPSEASEAALTLAMTRLTSTELLRFYKNFVKSASDLHSEVNQFLYSIVAQFYLNSGIPADQRIRHFDCLPRAFRAHINDILQVYIINHITATPAQGQAAISTSDCHFLILELGLIIPKEVNAGGHSINFREVCEKSDRLDIVALLDKTSSIEAKTTLIEDGPIMVSALA